MYKNNEDSNLKAYKSYINNREGRNGGGIEIMVKKNLANRTVIVSEGSNTIEELTIRTETRKRTINVISLYGKIESRENKENIREQFDHLEEIIKNIEKSGEDYILIGDLNAKIGNGENGIKENKPEINEAGKSLLSLEKSVNGMIINKTKKCRGMWTRINTQKETEKSVLDYVMSNVNVYEDIREMRIDEEKLYRPTKYRGKKTKETDHNTIIIELNDERPRQRKERNIRWNTSSKEGWEKFKKATENNKELDETWRSEDTQNEWKRWLGITKKILNETFGVVRITNRTKTGINPEIKELLQEKRELRKMTNKAKDKNTIDSLILKRKEIEGMICRKIEKEEEEKIDEITDKLNDRSK